jgi:hypothetical protein
MEANNHISLDLQFLSAVKVFGAAVQCGVITGMIQKRLDFCMDISTAGKEIWQ